MNWSDFLILLFATQRLTNIWFHERAGERPRLWMLRRGGPIAYLGGCPLCLSVWIGGLLSGLWLTGTAGQVAVMGFAASAGALFLDQAWTYLRQPKWPMPTPEPSKD